MNRKTLYLEIGNIDDDLIQEAAALSKGRKRKNKLVRFGSVAACFCVLCAAILFGMNRDVVYYNELTAPSRFKIHVPSEENAVVYALDYEALFDHYGLEPFADKLFGMQRVQQGRYFVYRLENDEVYDTNMLNYHSDDGARTLSVVLEKSGSEADSQAERIKRSKIDGVSVVLTVSDDSAFPVYGAEFQIQTVSFRVQSVGMDEVAFVDLIRELIQQQK